MAIFAISLPVHAIELPPGAAPTFYKDSTAYSSSFQFNKIMEAYGLTLEPEAVSGVPASFAKASGDTVTFNDDSIAYTPMQYHSILTAYGLELSPDAVNEKLGPFPTYATAQNDTIVFGDDSIAYGGDEWATILSAYSLPVVEVVPVVVVQAGPGDEDGDGVTDDMDACPDTPRGVAVDERGCWALSSALLFDFDKAVIKKEFYPILDESKKIFDDYPNMRVQIDGHTDSTGPEAYNQILSERRAKAVLDYLVNTVGIDANRLKAVGHGEMRPAVPNDTEENRAKNRRVEFTPII